MKLAGLNPYFIGAGGEGVTAADGQPAPLREGVGLVCDCPCGKCGMHLYVPFANPLDGGPPLSGNGWQRTGDTFETLTLTPSILRISNGRPESCGWHGFITNGEVIAA